MKRTLTKQSTDFEVAEVEASGTSQTGLQCNSCGHLFRTHVTMFFYTKEDGGGISACGSRRHRPYPHCQNTAKRSAHLVYEGFVMRPCVYQPNACVTFLDTIIRRLVAPCLYSFMTPRFCSTRLETRIKESNACACIWVR